MDIPKPVFGNYVLHPHQVFAVKWMMERENDDAMRGGFLCDDMGLGKTVTTVGLMINKPVSRTLVLAPIAVLRQWIRTILSANGPAVYEYHNHTWRCAGGNVRQGRIFVSNYDKIISRNDMFDMNFNRIICDEAHVLRNYLSKKTTAFRKIPSERYWFLTGTPIVNCAMDITCLMSIANREIFPFANYAQEVMDGWMNRYALHRTIEQVRELITGVLPNPVIVHNHKLPFNTENEATFYRGIQGRINAQLIHLMEQDNIDTMQVISLLTKLRQISVHPQVYIQSKKKRDSNYRREDWKDDSTKTDAIVKIINSEKENHGFVIFCNFRDEVEILRERLSKEPSVGAVLTYEGYMNENMRADVVNKSEDLMAKQLVDNTTETLDSIFRNATSKLKDLPMELINHISEFTGGNHIVMLAQIQCAGTGLNLQHFDRVIFTTPWWTAALMDQAVGRVQRIGQTNQVHVHHVELEEEANLSLNIDDYMNERIDTKRELCNRLLAASDHRVTD